ncbi:MAG: hypothetical protein H5T70_02130, partial [Chloroflexi bacterium]|nr:hypothetical protein [Chloroflexota bacterium]
MDRTHKTWLILGLIVLLWVGGGACSCENLAARFLPRPTATLPAPPTPAPTATLLAPQGAGQRIEVEWTEEELNDYLASQTLTQQGLEVSEAQAILGQGEVIASFYVRHAQSGLSGEITLRGRPTVSEGKVYVRIEEVMLGPSFSGFTRLVAQKVIEEALKQYGAGEGIPVP